MADDAINAPRVQELVDILLDLAHQEHPTVEFVVSVPPEHILLLPRDGEKLWRTDDQGRLGYYSVHVYRDHQVEEGPPENPEIWVSPLLDPGVAATVPHYVADLASAAVTRR
jgi:hypothetical protein